MDYLPLPQTAHVAEVPYLVGPPFGTDYHYDGLEWLTFPDRKGWDKDAMYYRDDQNDSRYSSPEAAAIVQSWLLFGTLFETLDMNITQDYFVSLNAKGQPVIDFSSLDEWISAWMIEVKRASLSKRSSVRRRLDELCHNLGSYITGSGSQLIHGRTPLPYEVSLSILCLVSYLEIAKSHVFSELGQCLRISTPIPAAMKEKMMQSGWCPSDTEFMQGNLPSLVSSYYLSFLGPNNPDLQHLECTGQRCRTRRYDPSTYRLRHQPASCRCVTMVQMDKTFLQNALRRGEIPMITAVNDSGAIKALTFPYRQDLRFVAISHVWAHGLGNEATNAVPACQMSAIQSMVDQLYTGRRGVPFWLDTLCIPTASASRGSSTRREAIKNMKRVYAEADKVLVIDKSLLAPSRNIADLEIAARIMKCDWMRRIWPLQEGAKARELHFQFADGALSAVQILGKIDLAQRGAVFRPVQEMMRQFLKPVINLLQLGSQKSEGVAHETFANALASIQWRETEHDEDLSRVVGQVVETPTTSVPRTAVGQSANVPFQQTQTRRSILGSIMTLTVALATSALSQHASTRSTARVANANRPVPEEGQSHTQRLLLNQGTVPADILFQEGQKFIDPGWRWCPRLLSQRMPDGAYSGERACTITRSGLRGQYPAIRIRTLPNGKLNHAFNLYDDSGGSMMVVKYLVASDQGRGSLTSLSLSQFGRFGVEIDDWLDSIANPAIILDKELVPGQTELAMGAIVDIVTVTQDTLSAVYKRRAAVQFLHDLTSQSYRAAAQRTGSMQAIQEHMREELRFTSGVMWTTWLVT